MLERLVLNMTKERPKGHPSPSRGHGGAIFGIAFFGDFVVGPRSGPTFGKRCFRLVGGLSLGCVLGETSWGGGQKKKGE